MNSGIYIHIPFCESKCGYCDFFSITDLNKINKFLSGLEKEVILYAEELNRNELYDTIYIGGGTPSVLTPGQLNHILELLHKKFSITNNAEITIEINPGTVNLSKLIEVKESGINRLSIGVQSFNDEELKFLGRIHNANQAAQSVLYSKNAGFKNISIDLIYALPAQSLTSLKSNLKKAIAINPEHISAYNLTIEKDTPFYDLKKKGSIKPLSESKENNFFDIIDLILTGAGYNHYEISNYAMGEENISRHNYKYWTHNNYLGFGPSAHSFRNNQRWGNFKSVDKYVNNLEENKKPVEFTENLNVTDLEFEHIFLCLRTYEGLQLVEFQKRFKCNFEEKYKLINNDLINIGCAEFDKQNFRLTKRGMVLCDEILPKFIKN